MYEKQAISVKICYNCYMSKDTSQFQISYDGSALANHEMDVKDLAPALLAIGELLEEANKVLNGEETRMRVNIKAPQQGSVEVYFSVVQDFVSSTKSLFSGDGVTSILNAHQLVTILLGGGGTRGVLYLLRWLKNRKIKSVTKIEMDGYRIEVEDGDVTIAKETVIKLFSFVTIRKKFEAIIKPLNKDGIDTVKFSHESTEEEVKKDEASYFTAPMIVEEIIDEREYSENLKIVNISFQDDGKWKFFDGNDTFFATILDSEFLDKIKKNERSFAHDDILNVKLKRTQSLYEGTIKNVYIITKVVDHRSAAVQIKLPFSKE